MHLASSWYSLFGNGAKGIVIILNKKTVLRDKTGLRDKLFV